MRKAHLLVVLSVISVSCFATANTPVCMSDNSLYNIVIPGTEPTTNDVDDKDGTKPRPKSSPNLTIDDETPTPYKVSYSYHLFISDK